MGATRIGSGFRTRPSLTAQGAITRRLVGILPSQPVVDVRTVAAALEVDKRTAQRGIERLARAGVLREVTGDRRNRVWAADELFEVLDGAQLAIGRDTGGRRPAAPSRHLRSADEWDPEPGS